MKNLFSVSLLVLSVLLFSCSGNNSSDEYNRAPAPGSSTDMNIPATGDATNPFAPPMDPAAYEQGANQQVAQQTGKVDHYICPNGHAEGGSDAGGNCKVCGVELVHNDAFHNQPAQSNPSTIQPEINPVTPTSPGQNSGGVFHYICPEGHAGGSANMENCAVCGKQLVHNDKYHQ
jgi:hypothetical protein